MTLKSQLDNDLKTALLGGDRFRADVLRNLKAAILNEEVAQNKRDQGLDDTVIEQIIAKEVKKRLDSVQQYTDAARPELAEAEQAEAAVLNEYLPEQLSEEEVQSIVTEVIAQLSASDPQAMGQVIGAVKARVGNTADGAMIARLVKQSLN